MNQSIEQLAAATAAAKALARVKYNDSTRFKHLGEGIRDEINMPSNDTARTHQQFLQVMHKGRHVIAAAIIGVRIGFARHMSSELIQHTLKNTTNGAGANAINTRS
jgi:hypothetical protein